MIRSGKIRHTLQNEVLDRRGGILLFTVMFETWEKNVYVRVCVLVGVRVRGCGFVCGRVRVRVL